MPDGGADRPLVSVVVTTYTRRRLADVQELLDSLGAQTYENVEVLFVAERERDLCEEIAAHAARRGMRNVTVAFNEGMAGLSPARNLGIERSQGAIVALIDDDAVAAPGWVGEIVRTLESYPHAIGVTGPAFPLWEDAGMAWFPEEFFWIVSCPTPGWYGSDEIGPIRAAWGTNMAFRREAFSAVRFSEEFVGGNMGASDGTKLGLLGDDTAFSLALGRATGRPILYNPAVRVRHKVAEYRLTGRFIRYRSFWEGYTKAMLRKTAAGLRMSQESSLLRRIVFSYLPRQIASFPTAPALAWRRLSLAFDSLAHVAIGYAAGTLPRVGPLLAMRYRS